MLQQLHMESAVEAGGPPDARRPSAPQTSGALLEKQPRFPCGSCRAFHNNDSRYSSPLAGNCRTGAAPAAAHLPGADRGHELLRDETLGARCDASATWICGLVAYVAALLYLIPTIRSNDSSLAAQSQKTQNRKATTCASSTIRISAFEIS